MSLLETFHLEHIPSNYAAHIALFKNVKNAAFLQQQLLCGNTDFEYAFIDASVILSKLHVLSAVFRAVNDLVHSRLRSRNVHSEIVFSLSPNKNIAESFRRFGIQPTTASVLVIKVSTSECASGAKEIQEHLGRVIEGKQVAFDDESLKEITDIGRVRKIYKLNTPGGGGNKKVQQLNQNDIGDVGVVQEQDGRKELEVLVIGCMALRGATN